MDKPDDIFIIILEHTTFAAIARECKLTRQAVKRWRKDGMPFSIHTGETNYDLVISKITGNAVTPGQIKAWSLKHRQWLNRQKDIENNSEISSIGA